MVDKRCEQCCYTVRWFQCIFSFRAFEISWKMITCAAVHKCCRDSCYQTRAPIYLHYCNTCAWRSRTPSTHVVRNLYSDNRGEEIISHGTLILGWYHGDSVEDGGAMPVHHSKPTHSNSVSRKSSVSQIVMWLCASTFDLSGCKLGQLRLSFMLMSTGSRAGNFVCILR